MEYGGSLIQCDKFPYSKRRDTESDAPRESHVKTDTQGGDGCVCGAVWNWGDASTSQEMPRTASNTGCQDKGSSRFSSTSSREHGPADTLVSGFQDPEPRVRKLLL